MGGDSPVAVEVQKFRDDSFQRPWGIHMMVRIKHPHTGRVHMGGSMFYASHPVACAVSSPDRSFPCSSNETLVQLLAAAITTFDSDRDTDKACIQRAAELLKVSKDREGYPGKKSFA
jgi:hypothetical protein